MSKSAIAARGDHLPPSRFTSVPCTVCGGSRLARHDGSAGACSFLGCPAPLRDVDVERGVVAVSLGEPPTDILTLSEVPC